MTRRVGLVGAATVASVGAGCVLWGWAIERKWFALRTAVVTCLPADATPIRVLHISDLHATPGQPWKVEWVQDLARLEPDLVIDTGDNLAAHDGLAAALDALGPLLELPGGFVPGSNDWFAPTPKNPGRYLLRDKGKKNSRRPVAVGRDARCVHHCRMA